MAAGSQSAVYVAELVDHITRPTRNIIRALDILKQKMDELNGPTQRVSQNMQSIAKSFNKVNTGSGMLSINLAHISQNVMQMGHSVGLAFNTLSRGFRNAALAAGAGSAAILGFFGSAASASGDAGESQAFFDQIMGNSKDMANAYVNSLAEAFSRAPSKMRAGIAPIMSQLLGSGLEESLAAKMSLVLTKVGMDTESALNFKDPLKALQTLQSTMAGESEPGRRVGINTLVKQLDEFAASQGINLEYKNMDAAQRQAIVFLKILEDIEKTKILGQTSRELGNYTATMRALSDMWLVLKENIGDFAKEAILPALRDAVKFLKGMREQIKSMDAERIQQVVKAIYGIAGGLLAVAGAFVVLSLVFAVLAGLAAILTPIVTLVGSFVTLLVSGTVGMWVAGVVALVAVIGLASAALAAFIAIGSAMEFNWTEQFSDLLTTGTAVFDVLTLGWSALTKAVAVGDWSSAWQSMALTGKIVFVELAAAFVSAMERAFDAVSNFGLKMFSDILNGNLSGLDPLSIANSLSALPQTSEDFKAQSAVWVEELKALRDSIDDPPAGSAFDVEGETQAKADEARQELLGILNKVAEAPAAKDTKLSAAREAAMGGLASNQLAFKRAAGGFMPGASSIENELKTANDFLEEIAGNTASYGDGLVFN